MEPAADPSGQEAVFAFLADPATHGIDGPVRRIETHGAAVFLAGDRAYKVKRAVRFSFLDYSTPERRAEACAREVEINRRTAPDLYLGTVRITREPAGLALDGPGVAVDHAVVMRRFDESATLDRVAEAGAWPAGLTAALADAVCAAHADAPPAEGGPAAAALAAYVEDNDAAFTAAPDLFEPAAVAHLTAASRAALVRLGPLLLARGAAGEVRRCHGDLHLRNIVLIGGRPVLFDAIEFDDGIATGDLLYDLAFLLMDLWERGLEGPANGILNRYLEAPGGARHLPGLAALPLFLSLRAAIRAKVTAANLAHLAGAARTAAAAEATRYFRYAGLFVTSVPPRLVAVGGLSGTGKSVLAERLAPALGRPPGAVVLRSDVIRKAGAGVAPTARLGAAGYAPQAVNAVYAAQRSLATIALAAGSAVILDATHRDAAERAAAAALASAAGVPFTGLWLTAPDALRLARVGARTGDASDADVAVAAAQQAPAEGVPGWIVIDAAGAPEATLAAALAACVPTGGTAEAPAR